MFKLYQNPRTESTRSLQNLRWYQLVSFSALATSAYGVLFPVPTLRVSALENSSMKATALAYPRSFTTWKTRTIYGHSPSRPFGALVSMLGP